LDGIDKLNAAAVEALADQGLRSRLADLGLEVFPRERQTPEALNALRKNCRLRLRRGGGHLPAPVLKPKANGTMIGWLNRADHTTRFIAGCPHRVISTGFQSS
jgi:hypothetical protein